MNFFGHAAVATWRSSEPSFVLGAMLPDFWSMIRGRPPGTRHPELGRGIDFHHATDDVFHDTSVFRALTARAFDELTASGVRRSSARAVAHVGVEILLDGELAENADARAAYLGALEARETLAPEIVWSTDREALAFRVLLDALAERGVSVEHRRAEIVALRISRALAHRPRLALDGASELLVRAWADRNSAAVGQAVPELLAELRRGLIP